MLTSKDSEIVMKRTKKRKELRAKTIKEVIKERENEGSNLEHAYIIVDPFLLVLCDALGNPCDVADFLEFQG